MTGPEHVALPKWPGLLVEGDPVTPDQAAEIIIRTSGLEFHTNDGAFSTALYQELGLYVANRWGFPKHHLWTAVRERYGVLSLHYLENAQIVSSWGCTIEQFADALAVTERSLGRRPCTKYEPGDASLSPDAARCLPGGAP